MVSIVIIGKGAREHAIKEKLNDHNVFMIAFREELDSILEYNNIDLIIVGSEKYLVEGIVDDINIPIFGPTRFAAQIEGSKIFAKNFMNVNQIPTADYLVLDNKEAVIDFLRNNGCQKYVIKKDGLAGGKGVFLPNSMEEVIEISKDINEPVIIEERLTGQEVSVMAFCNGHDLELMPQIKDYKRIGDNDTGPNTGGMGAIGPVKILNTFELRELKKHMLKVVRGLNFKGVLYAGVIKTDRKFYILEFNCRFGDPETQVALNLLSSDLYKILLASVKGKDMIVEWQDKYCANVVLSHIDYPYKKLASAVVVDTYPLNNDIKVYWANPTIYQDEIFTHGGRVASVVSSADNLFTCLTNIYNNIYKIDYEGRYYRRDIGLDYLKYHCNNRRLKIGILSSGNGTSIVKLLDNKDISIEIIISNKLTSILDKAKNKNITHLYLPSEKNKKAYYDKLANILNSFDLDLILAVGYMEIIPANFCKAFEGKIFNIHPSLLPAYKGMTGQQIHQLVLDKKETMTGCTLHHLTPDVDGGRIVLQKQYIIQPEDDCEKIKNKVQALEAETILDFIKIQQNIIITYKDAGVDIDKGDDFVNKIKDENIGSFCAVYKVGDQIIGTSTDGVGTKLELANQYNKLYNIGFDLVAMCVNDLIVRGIKPKIFLDYIAMNKLDNDKLITIINSIKRACSVTGCALLGGETAEMPGVYRNECLDLAGFAIGVLEHKLYPLPGIKKGCKIYGLASSGIHSNGYSLVRKLLKFHHYDIDKLLTPTKIYMECFDIMEKYQDNLLALAHITGGGLVDNIKRVLPDQLEAKIDIDIKQEFDWIQSKSGMNYQQMISTFNCGYGIALIFRKGFITASFDQIGEVI